jgi:hypothetical protein
VLRVIVDRIELRLKLSPCHPERGRIPESKEPEYASDLNADEELCAFIVKVRGIAEQRAPGFFDSGLRPRSE